MSTVNDTDLLLVERNGVQYQITYDQMSTLNDDDLLLVERGGVQYKVEAQHVSTGANGLIIPPVEVLTPVNGAGITEFDSFEPVSSAITAVGEAGTITKQTDNIQSVSDVSNWNQDQVWTNSLTGSPFGGYSLTSVFDGNTSTELYASSGTSITFTPGTPIPVTSSIRICGNASSSGEYIRVNGNDATNVPSGGVSTFFVPETGTPITELTTLEWYTTSGSYASGISAIEIDGKLLVDAGISGATVTGKILSFPTNTNFSGLSVGDIAQQEYVTLNPDDKHSGINLSNGNLTNVGTTTNVLCRATSSFSSGKWYYEATLETHGGNPIFGWADGNHNLSYLGNDGSNKGYGYAAGGGLLYSLGGSTSYGVNFSAGSVLGVAADLDAGTLEYFVNGNSQGVAFTNLSGELFPAFSSGANSTVHFNFGATPFVHTPPSGYSGVATTATITAIDASAPSITVSGGDWDTSNQSQVWSSGLTTPSNSFNSGQPATSAFDGDLSTFAGAGSIGEDIVFQPTTPVSYTDSIEVYTAQAGQIILNSDSPVATTDATGWVTLVSGSSGSINTITIDPNSNRRATLHAIRVDGKLLVDAVEDSQNWGDYITISEGLEGNYNTDTTNMFDGDTSTATSLYSGNSRPTTVVLTPPSPITVTSGLRVYMAVDRGQSISVNGSQTNASVSAGWNNTGFTGTLTTLTIGPANAGSSSNINAIEIDGKLMLTPGVRDFGDRSLSSSITYDKSLTFTDDTQLANMVGPLEMTDANGDVVTPVSDTIANVSGNVLTLQGDTNLAYFQPGDEVQTGVQVVSVDAAAPSITVDGGSWLGADGSGSTYEISKSLRFNSADVAHLSKEFSSSGNRKTWTWSSWVKISSAGYHNLFANLAGNTNGLYVYFYDNKLYMEDYQLANGANLNVDGLFRDYAGWEHIVIAYDTTQANAADRVKVYVNGEQRTVNGGFPAQNQDGQWNQGSRTHYIGRQTDSITNYTLDAYLADVHFVDGQALAPTAFGDFDSNGIWQANEFDGNHNAEGIGGTINTLEFTGNGPHGPHAIRVDGVILTGADYTNGTLGSWSSNTTNPGGTFDGILTGGNVSYSNNGGAITWTATGGLNFTDKVEIYVGGVNPFYVNLDGAGAGSALNINSWNTIAEAPAAAGVNGFHLDFSDSSSDAALGYDAAGSNDWTVNNLSAPPSNTGLYASNFESSNGFNASYPAMNAFDGSTSTYAQATATGGNLTFTPSTPIAYSSSIKINMPSAGATASVNGGSAVSVANSSETTIATGSGTLTSLVLTASNLPGLVYIKIDDQILVNTGLDSGTDSLTDSPTSNHCTWNPLNATGATLTNGNLEAALTAEGSGNESVRGTLAVSSGKYYWENIFTATSNTAGSYGVVSASTGSNIRLDATSGTNAVIYMAWNGSKAVNGAASTYGAAFTVNDVIGVALDLDGGTITFYKNGISQGSITLPATGIAYTPTFAFEAGSGNAATSTNFGQREFVYGLPSGFKTLNVGNIEATIKDGSKHFDTVVFEGNSSTNVVSGFKFSPDLVWIKGLNGYSHCLFDTVRGAGKRLATDGTYAEDDYNLLNSFNSDGFTLGTTAGGGAYVQNTTGSYAVAWAWNAGDTTVTNYDGDLTSQVRANPEAGFSIVSVTEAAASGGSTVGHGLNAKPQMIIEKNRGGTTPWYIHHSGLGDMSGSFLRFDTSAKGVDNAWNLVEPTSTTFGIDPTYVLGDANADVIYYCFAPVEGFSAMGSYIGTGTSDNSAPFIYTGFKPAFLLIKHTGGDDWYIYDNERSDKKPLFANGTYGEQSDDRHVEFLSNGFKIRYNQFINASGAEMIYMAFAEHPVNTTPEADGTGDTQVTALDALVAAATEIVETDGTTMYLNGATGPWRTGLSIEGSAINAAAPGPSEITFTSQNQGTPAFSGVDATLASRTWTLESGTTATGPWTLVDTYVDYGVLSTQTGATPWTENKPTLQPNTFYRIKVQYDSTNATSVESVYNTFKTGDA